MEENYKVNEKVELTPIKDKYMLSIKEASSYFSIGRKRMRRLAETHQGEFAIRVGHRYKIIRPKFEEYVINLLEHGELEFWEKRRSLQPA